MHIECKRGKFVNLLTPIYFNNLVNILTTNCLSFVSNISKIEYTDSHPLRKSDVITFSKIFAIKSFIYKVDRSNM